MMHKTWLIFCLLSFVLWGCGGDLTEQPNEFQTLVVETAVLDEQPDDQPTIAPETTMSETMSASGGSNMMGANSGMMAASANAAEERQEGKRPSLSAQADSSEALAIDIAATHPPIAEYLADFNWVGSAYPHDDTRQTWGVDFSSSEDEWLGWADVNVVNGEVNDFFVPRDLPAEEFQAGQAQIKTFLDADAEINALLGDASLWENEIWYNRWEANWEAWYGRGLDEWIVTLYLDSENDELWIESINDPSVMEAEEQRDWDRNQAVELAFEAEGLWATLDGIEGWRTLASDHGDGIWTVDFVAPGTLYFSTVVDIVNWQIIEAGSG